MTEIQGEGALQGDRAPVTPIKFVEQQLLAEIERLLPQYNAIPHFPYPDGPVWELFDSSVHGLEIERVDDAGFFERDDDALAHVALCAASGDRKASLALAIHTLGQIRNQMLGRD